MATARPRAKREKPADLFDGAPPPIGDNSEGREPDFPRLGEFVDRIERLEAEKQDIAEDIKAVKAECKATGFDMKIVNIVLRRRRRKAAELSEEEQLIELYEQSLARD